LNTPGPTDALFNLCGSLIELINRRRRPPFSFGGNMQKKHVPGGRKAFLKAETITNEADATIQPDQLSCLLGSDSDAGATISPVAEEEIGLFRPRLHWISEK